MGTNASLDKRWPHYPEFFSFSFFLQIFPEGKKEEMILFQER